MGWIVQTTEDDTKGSVFSSSQDINFTAAVAADVSLKAFQDVYLGTYTSNPSQTVHGTSIAGGMLYFNQTDSRLKYYDGSNWVNSTPTSAEQTNINTVAADATDIGTVATNISSVNSLAAKSTQIGLLGTSDAIADMNTLGTSAIVTDMDLLATTANVASMGILGTATNVTNMGALTATGVITNITNLNATGVIANIATVAGDTTAINTVANKSSLLTSDFVSDLNTLATTAIIDDINILATSANVDAMSQLGTTTVVSHMAALNASGVLPAINTVNSNMSAITAVGTSSNITNMNNLNASGVIANIATVAADVTDIGVVAGKTAEISRLGTSDAVADMNTLATSDIVDDMNLLATSANVTNMGLLGTSANVTNMANLNASGVVNNIATVAGSTTNINIVANDTTEINALAAKTTELGLLGTSDAIADMNTLAHADVISDMNALATSDIISDLNTLATTDIVDDMNTLATTANVNNMATLGASGVVANIATVAGASSSVTTVATNISNVNSVATNLSGVNSFADRYRIASSAPSSSLDAGDLYFDTSSNKLNVYDGANWQSTAEAAQRALTTHTVSSAGTQTISVSYSVGLVDIYLNGLHLAPGDFTASNGSSVVITGCSVGDVIDIVALSAFNAANYGTISSKNVGISAGNVPEFASGVADNDFLKIDGTTVEGRSVAEVRVEIVDEHINTSGASSNQFLKWNGSDYVWDTVDTSTLMPKSGGTFTGAIDMGSNNITTTGKMLYSNIYSQTSDLPSASTYHGMFAHVHGTGKGYFAHAGAWVPLANEASPALTGTPTAPTASAGTSNTQIATTAYADTAVSNLVDSSPAALNTLNELAAALGDDANFSTTVTNSIGTKLNASAVSTFGGTLIDDADAAAARTTLGLGTAATATADNNTFVLNPTSVHVPNTKTIVLFNDGGVVNVPFGISTAGSLPGLSIGMSTTSMETFINFKSDHTSTNTDKGNIHYNTNDYFTVESNSYLSLQSNVSSTLRSLILSNTEFRPFLSDNNQISLGSSSGKFHDLHLGGVANIATHVSSPIYYTGVGSQAIMPDGNDLKLVSQSNELHAYFYNNGAAKLYHDNSVFLESANSSVTINKPDDQDDAYIYFGQNSRARLHSVDGSFLSITNSGSSGNDTFINAHVDSYTYLYHNGNATARTTNDGFQIFSASNNDDGTLYIGDNGNARMQNDEDTSTHLRNGANDSFIWSNNNTYTYIYYDGSWKLRTESNGVRLNNVTLYGIGSHNLQLSSNNAQNMVMYAAGTGSNGLLLLDSAGNYPTQLYGDANAYGFLASAWGNWDIKKVRGGAMTLNNSSETVVTSANIGTYAGGGAWEVVSEANFANVTSLTFNVSRDYIYKILIMEPYISSSASSWISSFRMCVRFWDASAYRQMITTRWRQAYSGSFAISTTSNTLTGDLTYNNTVRRYNQSQYKSFNLEVLYHQGTGNTSANVASYQSKAWGGSLNGASPAIQWATGYDNNGTNTITQLNFINNGQSTGDYHFQGRYKVMRIQAG